MNPVQLHKLLLEKASYDLPVSSIYRMLRTNRIKGKQESIPRSTRTRWIIPAEEVDALVIEYQGVSPHLSPTLIAERRPRTKGEANEH